MEYESIREVSTDNLLRVLVDLRTTLQKSRIQFGNRLSAIERGADNGGDGTSVLFTRWHDRFLELEKALDHDIADYAHDLPIVERMVEVKGVGYLLAAKVASQIDIRRASSVSALWRYAGFGVVDGVGERPVKGEKLHYNKTLKTTCFLIATSFMKSNSPYRRIYDSAREYYDAQHPEWTPKHRQMAAQRKMVKIWLSHLWEIWRELEGLPTRKHYAAERMGHHGDFRPQEFGWQ